VVARDGIEPPTPAFSGLLADSAIANVRNIMPEKLEVCRIRTTSGGLAGYLQGPHA
jgi:hypothetical protein